MEIKDIDNINYESELTIKRISFVNYVIDYNCISYHLLAYNRLMKIISGMNDDIINYIIINYNDNIIMVSRSFADFIKNSKELNSELIELERSSIKNLQHELFYSKLNYKDYTIELYLFDDESGLDIMKQFIESHKKNNILEFNHNSLHRLDIFTPFEFVYRFANVKKY